MSLECSLAFPGSDSKEPTLAVQETWVWDPLGWEPLEKGMWQPLQYSCLRIPHDRRAWWAITMGSQRVGHG